MLTDWVKITCRRQSTYAIILIPISSDPTEFGAFLDAFRCDSCSEGRVVSSDPLDYEADYCCDYCSKRVVRSVLAVLEHDLSEKVEAVDKNDDEALEDLLTECQRHLHTTNYLILALKRHLCYVYGRVPGKVNKRSEGSAQEQ
jgi:hypothetical protein